jgi:hypothetical protein
MGNSSIHPFLPLCLLERACRPVLPDTAIDPYVFRFSLVAQRVRQPYSQFS